MRKITLEKGKALLIRGDQGSGKSALARVVAKEHGSYTETTMDELYQGPFALCAVLKGRPVTVIVEEFTEDEADTAVAKILITPNKLRVECRGKEPELVDPPNFIFVSGNTNPIPLEKADRRFQVLTIPMSQQEQDAMALADELVTLQVVMAREAGAWCNLTDHQRSVIRLAQRKGRGYIEKYESGVKTPAEAG